MSQYMKRQNDISPKQARVQQVTFRPSTLSSRGRYRVIVSVKFKGVRSPKVRSLVNLESAFRWLRRLEAQMLVKPAPAPPRRNPHRTPYPKGVCPYCRRKMALQRDGQWTWFHACGTVRLSDGRVLEAAQSIWHRA